MSLPNEQFLDTGHPRGDDEPVPDVVTSSPIHNQTKLDIPVATLTTDEPQVFPWDTLDTNLDINIKFLTSPFPEGLNLSKDCGMWLTKIGVEDWEDFIQCANSHTVGTMMEYLSVDT